ncbi:MAG TPA: hypothetical protein VJ749_06735 [Pyrinomonadaceae bacterium]|nr:hypothetical protein [Pyrinomonadaceae bacterium]
MIMVEEFLRSGNLGNLRRGLSREEVRRLLGEPPDYSEKNWKHEIWKYDDLQVAFSGNSASFIGLYFKNGAVRLPASLIEDGRITVENDRVRDLEEFLRARNIDFTVDADLTFDNHTLLRVTGSGVGIGFTDDRLSSMQLMSQK